MSLLNEIRSIKCDTKELRKFGISFSIVIALWGSLLLWKEKSVYIYFYMVSPIVLLSAFFLPKVLKPLHVFLFSLVLIVTHLVTRFFLVIAYYCVFAPIGFFSRLAGKSFLDERIDHDAESYWHYREQKEFEPSSCERQF